MAAAALALLTSLCYGLSNFVGPQLSRDLPVYAVLIAGQFVAFVVSGAIVLGAGLPVPGIGTWGAAALAGFGNAWGLIALYRAAAIGPLSLIMPMGAVGALMPVLVGVASGEDLGALKVAGLALALAGVVLATRRTEALTAEGHDVRRALAWGLFSAVGFGVFLTFIASASEGGIFWAVMLSRAALLVLLGFAAYLLSERMVAPIRRMPRVAVPGVLLFAGTLCYAAATRLGDLSVVSVLGSLFPVVTVGLAFFFLGERLNRIQALGVVSTLVGVLLVSAHV